jgi:hypothetical protein
MDLIYYRSSNPQLIMVDGKLVVDQHSLQIQQEEMFNEDDEAIDEDASSRYVTNASFRNKKRLVSPKWTSQMTLRFYDVSVN